MKLHIASLAILCLALAVVPASAQTQTLWSNGPINGTVDAWIINFGYVTSDSFTVPYSYWGPSTVTGFDFGVWEFYGATMRSVDWSITSAENGGFVYGSGTAWNGWNLTDTFISTNSYNYDIDLITVTGLNVTLYQGTYWLNLQNATNFSFDPVYWDENSGVGCGGYDGQGGGCPSQASMSAAGSVPSEAFDIIGTTPGYSYIPEPGSIVLFGSGVLGLAGLLRRKLF